MHKLLTIIQYIDIPIISYYHATFHWHETVGELVLLSLLLPLNAPRDCWERCGTSTLRSCTGELHPQGIPSAGSHPFEGGGGEKEGGGREGKEKGRGGEREG